MLIKNNKLVCVFIAVILLLSLCNGVYADEESGSISHIVVEINDDMVLFTVEAYENALTAGAGNEVYDYMADGGIPFVRAVRSGDKFISIGVYGLSFADVEEIAGALASASAQDEDTIKGYLIFKGFDGEGKPILTPLFPAVSFEVIGGNGTLTAKVGDTGIDSGDVVAEGSNVAFTAAPDQGYGVKDWKKDGSEVDGVTGNTYTIANLQDNVTVTVEFEKITPVTPFSVSELYRESAVVDYAGSERYGVRELVPGVYNVELDLDKIEAKFGDISGFRLQLIIGDKVVKGEGETNIIDSFVIKSDYAVLPAIQQGNQTEVIEINPATLAEATVLLTPIDPASAPVSELYKEGLAVYYNGSERYGVREVVPGVYNVELGVNKVQAKFGDISGLSLQLVIDGKVVKGQDENENIIDLFMVESGAVFLPAIQQGNQTEVIEINPATLAEATVFLIQ